MWVEVSDADVVDRITILELKVERLAKGQEHARTELEALTTAWQEQAGHAFETLPGLPRLRTVNAALWDVEDALRDHEHRGLFDDAFVHLARQVYVLNDERAALKAALNQHLGSRLQEVKGYGETGRSTPG